MGGKKSKKDKAVWMLIGGIAAAIVGLSGVTFFRARKHD